MIDAAAVGSATGRVLGAWWNRGTPAVQLRQADGPRVTGRRSDESIPDRTDVVALPDGRIFVWGWAPGSVIERTLRYEPNGELIDPLAGGSVSSFHRRAGPKPPPVLLEDGTIALAAASAIHRLDPDRCSAGTDRSSWRCKVRCSPS